MWGFITSVDNLIASLPQKERTQHEQRIYEGGVPEGVLDTYAAEPQSRGGGFYQGILRVRETHPFGAGVEVKDPSFYSDPTRGSMTCILCGSTTVVEIHCKIVCKNCGFTRDCSDP
jgi:hypothetical protein